MCKTHPLSFIILSRQHNFTADDEDCKRCDFTRGQIWMENIEDCNKFFICEQNHKFVVLITREVD